MPLSSIRSTTSIVVVMLLLLQTQLANATKFGFTPFPYDLTAESQRRTQDLVVKNSTIYALHLDQCVPWHEVLNDRPLPRGWQREWDDMARNIPDTHTRYIAVTPTGTDRETLAPACGAGDGDTREMPRDLRGKRFDDAVVKRAYMEYVRRAVKKFRPDYINIGIEIDGMARSGSKWRQYEVLFDHVREKLRQEFPELKVGVEFVLQGLMKPSIAKRVKPLVERSDYLCLSFYPYGSSFGEVFGYPALGSPPDMWRKPLQWVRGYTSKPIAVCETGFITENINLSSYGLEMQGNTELQRQFTRDLVRTAKRDGYLFVIWFLAIDYDRLYEKMPKNKDTEVMKLWRNIGFLDGNLKPKPAWDEWLAFRDSLPAAEQLREAPRAAASAEEELPTAASTQAPPRRPVGFDGPAELFMCGPASKASYRANEGPSSGTGAMRWELKYKDDWNWCRKSVPAGSFSGTELLKLRGRSDREGMIIVNLEEDGGESFFALLTLNEEWDDFEFDLASLAVDDEKRQDGRLDPARIASITLADGAAMDGDSGSRTVWLSDFGFE